MSKPSSRRLAAILERLGAEATESDAVRVDEVLSRLYPDQEISDIPPEVFATLLGDAVVRVVTPSASSLIDLFDTLGPTQQARLMEHARALGEK